MNILFYKNIWLASPLFNLFNYRGSNKLKYQYLQIPKSYEWGIFDMLIYINQMFEKKMKFKICLNFSLFSPFTLRLYSIQISFIMLIKLYPQSSKVMCLLIKSLPSQHLFLQNQQFEYQINVQKLLTINTPERRR